MDPLAADFALSRLTLLKTRHQAPGYLSILGLCQRRGTLCLRVLHTNLRFVRSPGIEIGTGLSPNRLRGFNPARWLLDRDTGRQNSMPSASPMAARAAQEPSGLGDRTVQIRWPLTGKHCNRTWKLEERWLGPVVADLRPGGNV
jgi:hypothetical protein